MEFTYTVHIADADIKRVDGIIKAYLTDLPDATVDEALDFIFSAGVGFIENVNQPQQKMEPV